MYDITKDYPKIMAALSQGFEKFHEAFEPFGLESNIDEVSAVSYDGFIPHTNGGLRCMVMNDLRNVESEGLYSDTFESDILTPYRELSRIDAADEFIVHSDNEELGEAWENDLRAMSSVEFLYDRWDAEEKKYTEFHDRQASLAGFEVPAWHMSEPGMAVEAEREEFYEVSDQWLSQGGEFWYEARALFFDADNFRNQSGKPELFIFCGINTDFTYGRERGLTTSFEQNIPLEQVTPERIEIIVDEMIASITASTKEE